MGLDTVQIVLALEAAFGFEIKDKEAEQLQTTRYIIDYVCQKLNPDTTASQHCVSARAFYQLRRSVAAVTGVSRREIRPNTSLRKLFSGAEGRERWTAVGQHMGFSLPSLSFLGLPVGPGRFDLMTYWLVAHDPAKFLNPNEPWTRGQIRQIVRAIVADAVGTMDFPDDAEIVDELGLD
jgi:hypothetical protein